MTVIIIIIIYKDLLSHRYSSRFVFVTENISFIPVHSVMVGLVPRREKNVTK